MEDEDSIELSLGLACGGSSGKSKGSTSDQNGAEGSKTKATVGNLSASEGSFDKFFPTNTDTQDHAGQQKCENFWMNLGQSGSETDGTARKFWASDNNATDAAEEISRLSKRKMLFEGTNLQKKPEIGGDRVDAHGKRFNSITLKGCISTAVEEVSSAENEDVAESEAEGPSAWLISQHASNEKVSEIPKVDDKHLLGNSGLRVTRASTPIEVPNVTSTHNVTAFPSHPVMQLMPLPEGNHSTMHSLNSSNLQLAFGYPSVQLPTLERGSSLMLGFRNHDRKSTSDGLPKPADFGDELKTSHVAAQAANNSVSASASALDLTKGNEKHDENVGKHFTSQMEEEADRNKSTFKPNEITNQPVTEESTTIRPGVASGLKFGGTGSCPDLPWVSTTGSGPNGKTISGVTYKYSPTQIKIVCACHGSHLSPEEFIQHANAEDSGTENSTGVGSFPGGNVVASAHT